MFLYKKEDLVLYNSKNVVPNNVFKKSLLLLNFYFYIFTVVTFALKKLH